MNLDHHKPPSQEYHTFYAPYIEALNGKKISTLLLSQISDLKKMISLASPLSGDYRYAPKKWSVKQLIRHLIDSERVFIYRATCIARGDQQNLLGFSENDYAHEAQTNHLSLNDLLEELAIVRKGTILFFNNLEESAFKKMGTANGAPVSVRAILYIIIGHAEHHKSVLKDRYLSSSKQ